MCERWRPKHGDKYWIVDTYCCQEVRATNWLNDTDNANYKCGNCFKTKKEAKAAAEKVKELLLSLHEPVTDCNQLPKLTTEVFNHPDCPEWARYAAVDQGGNAFFHAEKPTINCCHWMCNNTMSRYIGKFDPSDWQNILIERPSKDLPKLTAEVFDHEDCPKWALYAAVDRSGHAYWYASLPKHEIYSLTHQCVWHNESKNFKMIPGKFDASDWQNSLIERPAEDLPDWCKVDAICWHKRCGYFKVTYIDDVSRRVVIQQAEDNSKGYLSFHTVCNEVTQADRRPYNNYEMASLVGKVLKNENGSVHWLVHTYLDDGSILVGNDNKYYADGIMGCSVDGVRTCHLKHLNEKGEWVE